MKINSDAVKWKVPIIKRIRWPGRMNGNDYVLHEPVGNDVCDQAIAVNGIGTSEMGNVGIDRKTGGGNRGNV